MKMTRSRSLLRSVKAGSCGATPAPPARRSLRPTPAQLRAALRLRVDRRRVRPRHHNSPCASRFFAWGIGVGERERARESEGGVMGRMGVICLAELVLIYLRQPRVDLEISGNFLQETWLGRLVSRLNRAQF